MGKSNYLDIKTIKKHARELRRNATDSEKILWEHLRNRRLSGYKFLRQHPIIYKADFKGLNYFLADFYCYEKKVVIELDGPIHEETLLALLLIFFFLKKFDVVFWNCDEQSEYEPFVAQ